MRLTPEHSMAAIDLSKGIVMYRVRAGNNIGWNEYISEAWNVKFIPRTKAKRKGDR